MASLLLMLMAPGLGLAVTAAQPGLDERDLALLGEPAGRPRSGAELASATERVTSLMRCPACQGLSVADSHTPAALAMRVKAETLLEAGFSEDQVLSYFEASYGEFIRLSPRPEGFNLVVWLLPAVALLVGFGLVWRRLRPRPRPTKPVPDLPEDDELSAYRERVREELGR